MNVHKSDPSVVLAAALSAILLGGCGGAASDAAAIRLVDRFDRETVEGAPAAAVELKAMWDFSSGDGSEDPLLGWKAGTGVRGLTVSDGRLRGTATTAFPILYVPVPEAVDDRDVFDSVEIRIRVSTGAGMAASGGPADANFEQLTQGLPWPMQSPLQAGDSFQNLTLRPQQTLGMEAEALMIKPVDEVGATFEIESIRAVSQRERRASIPSGVGWQGLGNIFHEAIVSRSPETFTVDVDIPSNAWLDLSLGTVEEATVTFRLAAVSGEDEEVLLERTLTTPHRWEPTPVDLSARTGTTKLRFSLDVPEERIVGFWGSPVIRVHDARPTVERPAAESLGVAAPPRGVILMMCDTLRKDHLSMYGHERDTAPYLARMASEGALFLDNVSQATWTKVSTPSIMTSLHPTSHGVLDFPDRLPAAADTLAEVYRSAGYATVSYSSVLFTGKFTNLHQGFEELHEGTSTSDPDYSAKTAREYVDRAADWIERHADTPFFMFLHVFDPHDPFEPRAPYNTMWGDLSGKEKHEEELTEMRKIIKDPLRNNFGMPSREEMIKSGVDPEEYVGFDKDLYDGSIRGMDSEVARLIERLRELGIERDVQFAFISDHGEEFIEHGYMFHGQTVYGELAGVPLMLYRPGVIPEGVEIAETVRSIDLMPTLLDLSGLAAPENTQGQSLVPLLAAARDVPAGASLAEFAEPLGWTPQPAVTQKAKVEGTFSPPPQDTESYGIVFDGWKLVHNVVRHDGTTEFELFDHAADPLDLNNVAEQHADVVESLKARLAEWSEMVEEGKLPKDDAVAEGLDAEELERLRSLGYVQ